MIAHVYMYVYIYIHTILSHAAPESGYIAIPGYQHFPVRLVAMQSSNWGPDPLAKAPELGVDDVIRMR